MVTALIVAAGKGTRMGAGVDKLFLEAGGLPLVAHTWRRFDQASEIHEIILVVRSGMEPEFSAIAGELQLTKPFHFVPGGKERQDSVWNGLAALKAECELVAIQDGARPCTSLKTISEVIAAALEVGAAVAAAKVTDTLKAASEDGFIAHNVDRTKLWAVQTPQVFKPEIIKRALEEVRRRNLLVTDDTAACELIGQTVKLVNSGEPNPKATSPGDLPLIEWLLRKV